MWLRLSLSMKYKISKKIHGFNNYMLQFRILRNEKITNKIIKTNFNKI